MPRRVLWSLLLFVVLVAFPEAQSQSTDQSRRQPQSSSQAPIQPLRRSSFQTGIDVVSLAVTVTDPRQNLVGNLQRGDFAVFEDGVAQDLAYFETGAVPVDLTLLIDVSASMEGKLPFVRKAATGFASALRPGDRASVVAFNNRVSITQPFTEDASQLKRAIEQIKANGGTSLYNALYITLKESARDVHKDEIVRRRAVVLLTDGEDTASLMSFDELLREAKREAITIYVIGLRGEIMTPQTKEKHYFSRTDFLLRALANETGALSFFPTREGDIANAYQTIGKELAEQYAIGYVSKNGSRNGAFRKVTVQIVNRPECRPRTRSGYLADTLRMATLGTPED